jgi:hypothetical protein
MISRAFLTLYLLAMVGCTSGSLRDHPECSEEAMGDWRIPAAWYQRELTVEKAHEQMLIGNLVDDAVRQRWRELHGRWREGDQYWRYRRPGTEWIRSLGWQEGVVLNRGCRQIGFVTTSVQGEEESRLRP